MIPSYEELQRLSDSAKPECEAMLAALKQIVIPTALPMREFFDQARAGMLQAAKINSARLADPLFKNTPIQTLQQLYADYYAILSPEGGYQNCAGDPDFANRSFGAQFAGLLSAFYIETRSILRYLFTGDYYSALATLKLYNKWLQRAKDGQLEYSDWLGDYRDFSLQDIRIEVARRMNSRFNPQADHYRALVESADLENLSYLYLYGVYIADHDLAMARFMASYDQKELKKLAAFIVKSWTDGFERAKRDFRKKRHPLLMFPCGMERLARYIISELRALGMEPLLMLPASDGINRQVGYDHRFDEALILDRALVDLNLEVQEEAMASLQELISLQAGPVYVDLFGEPPFVPVAKDTAVKFNPEQQQLGRELSAKSGQIMYKYYRRDETSFTIIAFPSPRIGDQFEDIFRDTLRINLLDSDRYARIQQHIIDVLDTAEYVHVKGKDGNDTDIKVSMHKLSDPSAQTLFENCVADVNIPVGEVFTSPKLEGTNGMLHVEDIYLGSLRYYNLRISFEDGWVKDYSCSNFSDPEQARKYVHENLIFPHDSLPIGEFAIGTNTLAYQIAHKYDIQALLPILIIEKMGPHFAIGDTCFSHEEDSPHPSFVNGKEMIAVENEKSATRKTDPVNAYTNKHMDITLPYDMLASITAVAADGSKTDIIRDGRFVVPGTQELNLPLDEMLRG